MPGEHRHVVAAIPQRRQVDAREIQVRVQVLAELPGGHRLFEIAVRRGHQAEVDAHFAAAARARELSFLHHAQQPCLQR
jgi:hypothetical protein